MHKMLDYCGEMSVSQHARVRSQQRGISRVHQHAVFMYGDREQAVGGGCVRLTISQRRLKTLVMEGAISAQVAERCRKLALITDGSTIVTNYKTAA